MDAMEVVLLIKQIMYVILIFSIALLVVNMVLTLRRLTDEVEITLRNANKLLEDVNHKSESLNFIFDFVDGFRSKADNYQANLINGTLGFFKNKKRKGGKK